MLAMTGRRHPTQGRRPGKEHGFTLIELMVALAVAAVMLTLAVPSFVTFIRNSELTSSANALVAAINTARTEAMKRGLNTMVVPQDGRNWTSGWVVFVDTNNDNTYQANTDTLLVTQAALPIYFNMTATGTANASPPFVRFNSAGYPRDQNDAFAATTISLSRRDLTGQEQLNQTRRVVMANTGRVRTCTPTAANDPACLPDGNG